MQQDTTSGIQTHLQNLQLHDHLDYHQTSIKAITIMSALCEEVSELSAISKKKFLPQLHLFCHDLKLDSVSEKEVNVLDEALMIQRDEEMLQRIGKFIVVLQNCHNFVNRIHGLVRNMVCQIHGCLEPLYDWSTDAESLGSKNLNNGNMERSGQKQRLFSSVQNVMPLIEGIAELLEVLIEIDAVIANNAELLEAWDVYKSIVMESGNDSHVNGNGRDGQRPVSFVNVRLDTVGAGGQSEDIDKTANDGDGDVNGEDARSTSNSFSTANAASASEDHSVNQNEEKHTSHPCSTKDLTRLQHMLMQLDFTLLSSRSFLIAIEQNFDPRIEGSQESLNNIIKEGVDTLYHRCYQTLGTEEQWADKTPIVGLYGMYCLYRRLLPSHIAPDEKLHKFLCITLPSHRPILPIFGELPFFPAEFISRYAPLERMKGFVPSTVDDIRLLAKKQLSKQDKTFCTSVSIMYRQGMSWIVSAECDLGFSVWNSDDPIGHEGYDTSSESQIVHQISLIRKGIDMAQHATGLLRFYLSMHQNLMEPIPSSHLSALVKLCYLAKGIEQVLQRRQRSSIVSIHKAALKCIASSLFQKLETLRSYVDHNHSSLDESDEFEMKQLQTSRIGAGLSIVEALLKGSSSFSPTRIYTIKVALNACYDDNHDVQLETKTGKELLELLYQLEVISDIDNVVVKVCDCSFLYFHKALFGPLLRHLRDKGSNIQLLITALSDAGKSILSSSTYLNTLHDGPLFLDQFREYLIEKVLFTEIVNPLVDTIENLLRQRVLSRTIAEMPSVSPKDAMFDFSRLTAPPLDVCGIRFSIKVATERALEKSLYSSATVGVRDTISHTEMLILAKNYGLNLVDGHLPLGAADQGMDILTIADNLEGFMSSFNYNMNQQTFIQRAPKSGSRTLNTVDIQCISMSLCRHGPAVARVVSARINTFILESLNKLLDALSDEYFYSLLAKERRWYEGELKGGVSYYSYDRALTFKSELDQQGDKGSNKLLQQSKDAITRIGNAIGFLRLLRSGILHNHNRSNEYCAMTIEHDTTYKRVEEYWQKVHDLPDIIPSMNKLLYDKKKDILSCIYIIYPPLSLLWLDSSASGKEMLRRKIKTSEGYFTDDGFAFGFAFLFEVIDQTQGTKYDSLNWSQSSRHKFSEEKSQMIQKAEAVKAASKSQKSTLSTFVSEDSSQDDEYTRLRVLAKRLETRKQELDLLLYCMNAARMIFSST